jgi:formate hydrogenlyase subunit 3/multisubunit Na+/H+ antiporter MnhD subunit
MNAPILWIVAPLLIASFFLLLGRVPRVSMVLGALFSSLIAISVLLVQVQLDYVVGPTIIQIESTFTVLGRVFILDNGDKTFVFLFYAISAVYLWFGVFYDDEPAYAPMSLAIPALLSAAMAVQIRLFSVLFVMLSVLLCLPLLVKMDGESEHGEQFLLIFTALSIPLLLLAGWSADMVTANPIDSAMMNRAILFTIVGFTLLMGLFPFMLWMPMVSQQTRPTRALYVLLLLPIAFSLLLFNTSTRGVWFREAVVLQDWLTILGYCMIALGGLWAVFEDDLRRFFAFGLVIDSGFALIATGRAYLGDPTLLFQVLSIRVVIFILFTLALNVLDAHSIPLTIKGLRGRLNQVPIAMLTLFGVLFSFNGIPLLAAFSSRIHIVDVMMTSESTGGWIWILVGLVGYFLGILRFLGSVVDIRSEQKWVFYENWPEILFLSSGVLLLLLLGLFPAFTGDLIQTLWAGFVS